MSLTGLYIGVDIFIQPESAALYIIRNAVVPGRMSPFAARLVSIPFIIVNLVIGYSSVQHLLRLYP